MYIRTYMHTYKHTYINTYTYIHTYIHTYIPTYIHTCMHTYIHTCIHTYLRTYLHAYLRTYIPGPSFDTQILVSIGCCSTFFFRRPEGHAFDPNERSIDKTSNFVCHRAVLHQTSNFVAQGAHACQWQGIEQHSASKAWITSVRVQHDHMRIIL